MSTGRTRRRPPAGPPGPLTPARTARYRSQQAHHRRRRRTFGLAVIVAALVLIVLASGGGSSGPAHHLAAARAGYFTRLAAVAGAGPGSFSAAEKTAENAAVNRTLAVTPVVQIAGAQHREVALTFDDGPGPYTPQVLDVLERTHTPGTFFEVGAEEQYFHTSTSRIVADGFPIGDHTEDHAPMSKLSVADQRSQLLKQISATGSYGAPYPRLFRPPYGLYDQTTLRILRSLRLLTILWTVDTDDYLQPGVDRIVNTALSGSRPGAIILMHDAGGTRTQTVAALPQIIAGLRARGYKLVTVPRLLQDNPAPANQDLSSVSGAG